MGVFGFVGCGDNEPNFADNAVLVILTNEVSIQATLELKEFTPYDFPDLELSEIVDLSVGRENVRRQLENDPTLDPSWLVNINNYRMILKLILIEPNHQTVLEFVETLKALPNIWAAEPNYIGGVPA